MNRLRTIAVDLVPLLPGGDNGGAKVFTIELLRMLAKQNPSTKFVLLTRANSHDELAFLDSPNVLRIQVDSPIREAFAKHRLVATAKWLTKLLPTKQMRRRARDFIRRPSGYSLTKRVGADLLFCPLTAPTFHDTNTPTVSVIYDLQHKSYPEFFPPRELSQRERTFKEVSDKADAVAVISDYVRNSVIKAGIISPERVCTIYIRLPYRLAETEPSTAAATLEHFNLRGGDYLFYPANFWRHKNHEMLLTGFLMARKRGLADDIKLVFSGALHERMHELEMAAESLGLKDNVVFAGYVSESSFSALLKNCLSVVFPSLYEGFGMPVLEAMAAGRPVACSNRTSLPEVAGDAALLFDPRVPSQVADAIFRISTDKELRANLIHRGRSRAMFFGDTATMAREYWKLFEGALTKPRMETLLQGIYDDGWTGPVIALRYAAGKAKRSVEVELHAPEWLPIKRFKTMVACSAVRGKARHHLRAGETRTIHVPIGPEGGKVEIRITPSFRPSKVLGNGDARELSLVARTLRIGADGRWLTIFPTVQT